MIGKLLIVDDESWFRDGLMMLISNEQLGWEVIGEASDGEEALAIIETSKPDLIITDIHMPVVDGLMLTEQLSKLNSDIMVIILTGYRDFEYARRALRYGAVDFLLKPMSIANTCEVLRQAYDKFRQKQLEKKLRKREKQINTLRAALYRLPYEKQDWNEMNALLCGYEFWLLRVDSFCPKERSYTEKDIELLHFAISNMAAELLQAQQVKGIFLSLNSWDYAFLLAPIKTSEQYRADLLKNVMSILHLKIDWKMGGIIDRLDILASRFNELHGSIQMHELPIDSEVNNRSFELRERLLSDLIIGDVETARSKLYNHIDQISNLQLHLCKAEVYALVTALSDLLATHFKHVNASDFEDLHSGAILLFDRTPKLIEWATNKTETFLQLYTYWLQEKQDNVVVRAIQYIESNYKEVCSLQVVGAYVHVTPNYLSNLFKRETGIAFSNYVSRLRVEKAKTLLACTKMRMTDIAEHVGFDNASYFTTVFKQLNNLSPSEYRKSYEHCDATGR